MEGPSHVYLFGDQTADFDSGLRRLLHAKNDSLLAAFFQKSYYALRKEITSLPPSERQGFPRFTSIVDLLARFKESGPNPALESALTTIHQLGCFIHYYGDLGHAYPSADESCIIGLCTGQLASAAVSSSRTIGELISAGIETVVLALRLGMCVLKVQELIEPSKSATPSWSVLISGMHEPEAENLIQQYAKKNALPRVSQPYISAVSPNGLTISGPPTFLSRFIEDSVSKEHKPTRVPIHGPYHASHLYDDRDINRILESWPTEQFMTFVPQIPVISSETGKEFQAESLEQLLRLSLQEILQRQLCWDKVIESCQETLELATTCTLFPISSTATQSLFNSLKKAGVSNLEVDSTIGDVQKDSEGDNRTGRAEQSKIAIIGLSGRFPESPDTEAFWDLLKKGLDVHREVPPERWDVKAHVDKDGKIRNTSQVQYGCWYNDAGMFDPRFFNMSPREALQADPAQRLALLTAYEALEMAGFIPDSTPSTQKNRVGVFYGMTSDDYREVNSGQDIDTYFIPGGNRAFTPGRINYYFKFSGPSVSVDTACSSSLAAIHVACNSLWRNECDSAVAGGVNILTNPDNHAGLDRGHFLSRTGNCTTFDDGADGYCRADGIGSIVIKRLEDAQADNDPIYGIIGGAYTNHSAEAVSITRPHVGAQSFIFDKLLNESNSDPKEISYIEMHGTGTQAGDAVEMQSVLDVFAPDYRRGPAQSLHLGSAKSNVGHGESASGVTALIKVLMMMQKNMIPPHCGIKTKINHNFPTDFPQRNVHIASEPTPWNRPNGGKRKTFVNNFSAAGGNTALMVEDGPLDEENVEDPRSAHPVLVSARSQSALKNNISALVQYIDKNKNLFNSNEASLLANLSYTTTARRIHHPFRVAVTGSTLDEVRSGLAPIVNRDSISPAPANAPGIGFVFTGQGAQYTGMGRQLFESCSQFRAHIEHLNCIGQSQGFPSILSLVDGSVPIEEHSPVVTQLGTTCVQMALTKYWMSLGISPAFVIGHSLGEFAALNASGVLTTSDTIYLAGRRAQLLTEQIKVGTHAMLAVKSSVAQVKQFLDDATEVACINAPSETVISGAREKIDELAQTLTNEGFKATKLNVPFAFHSAQVEPILESLSEIGKGVNFNAPSIPFVSALLGDVINESNSELLGPNYLTRHCRETVNFLGALEATRHSNLMNDKTIWIEIGSHPVCSGMVKATFGPQATTVASLRRQEDTWKVLSASVSALYMAGIELRWKEYHQDFTAGHKVLPLPSYKWDLKNYWIPYTNNFCLLKGAPAVPVAEAAPVAVFLSSAAQRVLETSGDNSSASIVIENDIADPELNRVIAGHKVNGACLTPSSLYADIAQTLGEYLVQNYKPEWKDRGFDICNMMVPKPLIAKGGKQLFRVSATANWAEESAKVQVWSVTPEGKKILDHASCNIKFFDPSPYELEWKRSSYLIKRSIEHLQESTISGQAHRMKRGMVYKLFASLVDYDDNYKSMREVILDSEQHEATAVVKFEAPPGNFHRNPFWIDSIGHLSGFIMNASDNTDSKNQVFVNHGWDSMRCLKKFDPSVTYRTYVRMQPWKDSIWAGDVYMFDGDDVVAVYGGVKFQGLARKILDMALPPGGASAPKPAAKRVPAPINVQKAKPSVTKKASPSPKSGLPSMATRALAILAEEVGLAASEMTDDLNFADYGVDSLLSLTVTGRYREDMGLDLDSTVFVDSPTVKDFKHLLAQMGPGESSDGSSSEGDMSSAASSTDLSSPNTSGLPTPANEKSMTHGLQGQNDSMRQIASILAEEIGVDSEELLGDANLGEMGLDSLMSLTVLGKIREDLDLDLPGEFFIENQTLDDIETTLDLKPKLAPAEPIRLPEQIPVEAPVVAHSTATQHPPATSILLQGNPKTATQSLFLFPDGSGSATSYATIPGISPDVCVYGLNCPYMRTPENLKFSLDELTAPYVAEIRRRQPTGPYNFGGWSAGGICAYDAARKLIFEEGERVERLLLLDSPFPIGLEKLPPRLYSFFDTIGLFGEGKAPPPKWLLPHFLAFIDSLDAYKAVPFPYEDPKHADKLPKTFMVWAKDGVCSKPGDARPAPAADGSADPREMLWLLNNRTDLGPNGWDTLVGPKHVGGITVMEDANHFTMTRGQKAKELARFIANSMASA
ncbi:Acyl transferase/acyl hydrolase/lysophospholipase [Penicillium expansum]|uniref:Conidial yellow pigment biosynthesis polyketide synthase melA n=1 Tax=Penicillium expansum TaxID=27334 RepID=MELA_PENEN|nr:Acyl transferase/acyl hydrolase/lysophospholipase [Penicillium expansum]A0A0A2KT65.1 RecName: Full=Conidial yellow pigment biosynthesis polyketide synthase melA; Short=PKS melA [Penicillium expansum]KGO43372.1 Acyl transferase/acyl hydrolase/lysophospholipase [Penicillium expansum]KGO57402.1 Acyl transferase/acyl hydrolase/lysophospholipase [Penicillium expansum]KGO71027.1 Acyl transferase/acyl hydrolase/lysophospholipase [Penicillium expansum]